MKASRENKMNRTQKFARLFHMHALLTLGALVLEFILGMYTALFVAFPDTLAGGNAWQWSFSNSAITVAHIILGTLMVLMALSTLGFGAASKSKTAILTGVLGLVMILIAYLSGSIFLGNIENDQYSFSMALGFIGAMVVYGLAYYRTRPDSLSTVDQTPE
jgi:heme A synthase